MRREARAQCVVELNGLAGEQEDRDQSGSENVTSGVSAPECREPNRVATR